MENEKRMIENYEVKNSIWFGGKEYILGEDVSGKTDEQYMTCIAQRNNPLGIEEYIGGLAGSDYLEIFNVFIERLSERSRQLSAERSEHEITDKPLTAADCVKGGLDSNIEGKVIIIKPEVLSPEYRTANHMLHIAEGGFGCSPDASGRAVYCKNIYSGEKSRFERYDIAGVADISRLPESIRNKITETLNIGKTTEKPSLLKELDENKKAVTQQKLANPPKNKHKDIEYD